MARLRKITESEMTPEQRAAFERFRAECHTPEMQELFERERQGPRLTPADLTPEQRAAIAEADPELGEALTALRRERERQGLSLADVSQRTKLDPATLGKLESGEIPKPSMVTLRKYARALGKRLSW